MSIKLSLAIKTAGLTTILILLMLFSVSCNYQGTENESWSGLLPPRIYTGTPPSKLTGAEEEKITEMKSYLENLVREDKNLPLVVLVYLNYPIQPKKLQKSFESLNITPAKDRSIALQYADGTSFQGMGSTDWNEMWRLALAELDINTSNMRDRYAAPTIESVPVVAITVRGSAENLLTSWTTFEFIRALSVLGHVDHPLPHLLIVLPGEEL